MYTCNQSTKLHTVNTAISTRYSFSTHLLHSHRLHWFLLHLLSFLHSERQSHIINNIICTYMYMYMYIHIAHTMYMYIHIAHTMNMYDQMHTGTVHVHIYIYIHVQCTNTYTHAVTDFFPGLLHLLQDQLSIFLRGEPPQLVPPQTPLHTHTEQHMYMYIYIKFYI